MAPSGVPLDHQIAISAALETLKSLTGEAKPMSYGEFKDAFAELAAPVASNVVTLPVRPRTCWTTICQLDGRPWATSSHFGPEGAWGWIVESVAHEHSVSEDQVGCAESGEDQPYDCDDLVTIDGLPVYRIQHKSNVC